MSSRRVATARDAAPRAAASAPGRRRSSRAARRHAARGARRRARAAPSARALRTRTRRRRCACCGSTPAHKRAPRRRSARAARWPALRRDSGAREGVKQRRGAGGDLARAPGAPRSLLARAPARWMPLPATPCSSTMRCNGAAAPAGGASAIAAYRDAASAAECRASRTARGAPHAPVNQHHARAGWTGASSGARVCDVAQVGWCASFASPHSARHACGHHPGPGGAAAPASGMEDAARGALLRPRSAARSATLTARACAARPSRLQVVTSASAALDDVCKLHHADPTIDPAVRAAASRQPAAQPRGVSANWRGAAPARARAERRHARR